MKVLLIISILLNVFLGVLYFQETNKPPLERIVIEHKKPEVIREQVVVREEVKQPRAPKVPKDGDKLEFDPMVVTDAQDYDDLVNQMETTKRDYFLNQLNLPEETLKKHDKMREQHMMETSKIYSKDPMGELSIEDKRELLRLEENYQNKVVKLYGKTNWEKIENYRRKYNMSVMKKVREENAPAILMAP